MTEVEREEALQKKRAERAEKEEFEDDGFWDQVNSYTNYRLNSR